MPPKKTPKREPASKSAAKSTKPGPKPVPVDSVIREIEKVQAQIRNKLKVASLESQKDLECELKVLEQCRKTIKIIWFC